MIKTVLTFEYRLQTNAIIVINVKASYLALVAVFNLTTIAAGVNVN
jgi:hypothetical protein